MKQCLLWDIFRYSMVEKLTMMELLLNNRFDEVRIDLMGVVDLRVVFKRTQKSYLYVNIYSECDEHQLTLKKKWWKFP
jgi:hypothetical protein